MTRLLDTLDFLRDASHVYIRNRTSLISFSTTLHIIAINLISIDFMSKVTDVIDQAGRDKRPVRQPTFTRLTLPPEYDNLNLVTRLWLQSRLFSPAEKRERQKEKEEWRAEKALWKEKRRKKKEANEKLMRTSELDPPSLSDDEDADEHALLGGASAETETATPRSNSSSSIPSSSSEGQTSSDESDGDHSPRTDAKGDGSVIFRSPGGARPRTLAAIWIWLDLCRELSPYLLKAVRHTQLLRMFIYLLDRISDSLRGTFDLYATSRLYDLCERALSGKPASWATALRVAGLGLASVLYSEATRRIFRDNDSKLRQWLETKFERQYLSMRLRTPLHGTDDLSSALVYEAGIFAGMENGPGYHSGPFGLINGISGALAELLDLAAQVTMLVQAIGGVEQIKKRDPKTIVLLGMAFAPSILSQLSDWLFNFDDDEDEWEWDADVCTFEQREELMRAIATETKYKQEATLFGLHDWCLRTWDRAREMLQTRTYQVSARSQVKSVSFKLLNEMAGSAFYVMLATKTIDTGLSLGSIHTYQGTARSLIYSVKGFHKQLNQAYQSMFYAAAFAGATEPLPRGQNIDYETTRQDAGMRIEMKDLSFTYPGVAKPTLKNINLVIEPGETLAIVGYNGGGKTTLMKLLTGLYDTTSGSLTLNGVRPRDYDPKTLNKRMSALFQDFNRYQLTLRENVGIGLVEKINDAEAVNLAIEEGGAQPIRDKRGIEVTLHPWGEPEPPRVEPKTWQDDSDSEDDEDEDEMQLSGGQWQRVGLARSFMRAKQCDLIVFDEPSSALDPRAEAELFQNIHNLANISGTTTVYISHRFNTVRKADRIALMENGTIAEYGTHRELMDLKGQYYELFNMQAEGFLDKTEPSTPATPATPEVVGSGATEVTAQSA